MRLRGVCSQQPATRHHVKPPGPTVPGCLGAGVCCRVLHVAPAPNPKRPAVSQALKNERNCPDILHFRTALIGRVQRALSQQVQGAPRTPGVWLCGAGTVPGWVSQGYASWAISPHSVALGNETVREYRQCWWLNRCTSEDHARRGAATDPLPVAGQPPALPLRCLQSLQGAHNARAH